MLSRFQSAPHWMVLFDAICRCVPKLSLRSNCALRHLMLLILATSCCVCRCWSTLRISFTYQFLLLPFLRSPLLSVPQPPLSFPEHLAGTVFGNMGDIFSTPVHACQALRYCFTLLSPLRWFTTLLASIFPAGERAALRDLIVPLETVTSGSSLIRSTTILTQANVGRLLQLAGTLRFISCRILA